jgi:hypothetical protein
MLALVGTVASGAPITLDDEQLDQVTAAGEVRIDVELSANATGPSAITSTQGSVAVGRTTASRVEIDPAAPEQARVRLLGQVEVDVGIAYGKAQAAGSQDATCSAVSTISGADYTVTAQSQTFTAISATCTCTAMAVGFLTH